MSGHRHARPFDGLALGRAPDHCVDDDDGRQPQLRTLIHGGGPDFRWRASLSPVQGDRRRQEIRGGFAGAENGIPTGG